MARKLSEKQLIILSLKIEQYAKKISETAIYHPEKLTVLSLQIQEMAKMVRGENNDLPFENMLKIIEDF